MLEITSAPAARNHLLAEVLRYRVEAASPFAGSYPQVLCCISELKFRQAKHSYI